MRLLFQFALEKLRSWSSIHKQYLRRHLEEFSTEIGHNILILDIGSGDAPYRHVFDSQTYVTSDLNARDETKVVSDICALPFSSGTVDAVVCTEVIEHVRDVDEAFSRLGFECLSRQDGDDGVEWTIRAPSHRFDIEREADLVEEICRIYGYNNVPSRRPVTSRTPTG